MNQISELSEADYVIVGAGSAGCAVAARLADSGASVILLEAGKTDLKTLFMMPGMIGAMHLIPQIKKTLDWGYYTTPQPNALNRKIPQTRGKVLGGSSSVNGMLWVRGNRANYDEWAAAGNTGWSADEVNQTYKRIENFVDGENEYRGGDGPVRITRPMQREACDLFRKAGAETLGVPELVDYNGASQEGFSPFQQSADHGLRYSSSRSYLHNGNQTTNLTVLTQAQATKVVIENQRAVGVEVRQADGVSKTIRAGKEVILSAGVFGSPHLLQLSGVGPAAHLTEHGLQVHADLPVGDNLHDHLFLPLSFKMPSAVNQSTPFFFGKEFIKEKLKPGQGFMSQTGFESVGFVKTELATNNVPDLQLHVIPWGYPAPNQDAPVIHKLDKDPTLTILSTLIYPKSRGTVRLASADPTVAPRIDLNYLAEPDDAKVLLAGARMIREIMQHPDLAGKHQGESQPGPVLPSDRVSDELRNRVTTVYHSVGSCRMGVDAAAVVNPQLQVNGIAGLRVADASIMPSIIGGNTNAPSIMIGEKCAEIILGQ